MNDFKQNPVKPMKPHIYRSSKLSEWLCTGEKKRYIDGNYYLQITGYGSSPINAYNDFCRRMR